MVHISFWVYDTASSQVFLADVEPLFISQKGLLFALLTIIPL